MSLLLDRLVGYGDADKLPIHQFVDALSLFMKGFPGAPTIAELTTVFELTPPEVADVQALRGLVISGTRTKEDILEILRLAERYKGTMNKARVVQLLGI